MKALTRLGLALLLTSLAVACGPQMGRRVRVATATPAELEAALNEDNVWYEFQPGDVIPVRIGFLGAMQGGADGPAGFRAKQQFFLVSSKNGPMRISFDGKTFAGPDGSQTLILVIPRKDGKGGQLGWLIYMGAAGNPEAELKALIEESQQAGPPAAEATQ